MRACTATSSPTHAFAGWRPLSTTGETSCIWRRAGASAFDGRGIRRLASLERDTLKRSPDASTLERCAAAPNVAARRHAGRRGIPLRRLAGGGGSELVAGAAARAARRDRFAVHGGVGVRGLAWPARRARRRGHRGGGRIVRRAAPVLDRRLVGVRRPRRGGRPGALRAGVERTPHVRRRPG